MNSDNMMQQTALEYRRRVCQAMNFISRNIDQDLSLEAIAESASFSRFHFHRIFKAVVGETVAEFSRRLRLELAANLLQLRPYDDVTTIAMTCGFSSSQNFAKAFRQHFSSSPTQYRKSKNGNNDSNGENALSIEALYNPDTAFVIQSIDERGTTMEAEVKEMPEYHVAYVRKMGPYGKETSQQAFAELVHWAGPLGYLSSGAVIGVSWDNPDVTPPGKCRTDACVSVPRGIDTTGQVALQTIKGGLHGVCHFEIKTESFHQAWEDAFTWLVKSGYECANSPCYELFHTKAADHPEGKWVFDICIPLRSDS